MTDLYIRLLLPRIEGGSPKLLRLLKAKLGQFNARSGIWYSPMPPAVPPVVEKQE